MAGSALIPSLLTLSDVVGTGYRAAVAGGVSERTRVTVIGAGAVGLPAVLSAKRRGAQQVILMGRHQARTDLDRGFGAIEVGRELGAIGVGRGFGAVGVVSARGEEGIPAVREHAGTWCWKRSATGPPANGPSEWSVPAA
ncbi:hypothetical protein GCM10017562_74410 [Streptomyces roseofulvus]|uniref:hypothetical protein n=1 Tax=Streptomyces roseofulvus TaxID=33902 RepID=UPI0031FD4B2E